MISLDSHGVYAIVRQADAVAYIGSTRRSFRGRFYEHKSLLRRDAHFNAHLQCAWNKYGEDAFDFVVLEETDDVQRQEQAWLDRWQTTRGVFNLGAVTNNPALGLRWHHSDGAKQRMRKAKLGCSLGVAHRRAIGRAMKGHATSQQARQKISQRAMGNTRGAKPYPAFIHCKTGEVINPGVNLTALCYRMGLSQGYMGEVKNGIRKSYKGWMLHTREVTR